MASSEWTPGRTGVPLLHQALAWFGCRVVDERPAGDHVLVLGKEIDARPVDSEAAPMVYRDTGDMDGAAAFFPGDFAS